MARSHGSKTTSIVLGKGASLKEGDVTADIFGVLAFDPNAQVKRVHPLAMPVIFTTTEGYDVWIAPPLG